MSPMQNVTNTNVPTMANKSPVLPTSKVNLTKTAGSLSTGAVPNIPDQQGTGGSAKSTGQSAKSEKARDVQAKQGEKRSTLGKADTLLQKTKRQIKNFKLNIQPLLMT